MKSRNQIILLILIYFCAQSFGQNHVLDSLRGIIKTERDDTDKVKTLNKFTEKLWRSGKYDTAIICAGSAKSLAGKLGYKKGMAQAYCNFMNVYKIQEDYPKSLDYSFKALGVYKELDDRSKIAFVTGNIGIIYGEQGDYHKSLDYFLKTLKIYEELGDKTGIASYSGDIGVIYEDLGDFSKSLDYSFKSLKMSQDLGDKSGIAMNKSRLGNVYEDEGDYSKALANYSDALVIYDSINDQSGIARNKENIANVYNRQENYPEALRYYREALTIFEGLGDKSALATITGNMASVYKSQGDFSAALNSFFKALDVSRKLGDMSGIAVNTANIGSVYTCQKNYSLAKAFLDSGLAISKSIGDKELIKFTYNSMAALDSALGNYKAGWENYKEFIVYRDSLVNEDNTKKLLQVQMNADFDRRSDSAKAAQDKIDLITEKESQQQKVILDAFVIGFILMMVFAFFIFRGYRQKQKANVIITRQKEEVESQKVLVEEKNKDILDSITYAKRLQDAILPPLGIIKKNIPDSFLLYRPKDIVAGDFYWVERAGDNILIAAADCTGHGVPGALVSVVCSNALNRTVKEFHITEPGKILDKVRELVLETFEKSESEVQDGMDISLCCINADTKEIQWSGAYNPLWYVSGAEMKELLADKQPIGKHNRPQPFKTHNLNLQNGDALYLFTDGFADQFGGPKGKKFKYRQLQEILLANSKRPMEEQKTILEAHLDKWKGDLEQVDDILVIGIRV